MIEEKIIQIKCKGSLELNPRELMPFQGNLKELTEENYQKLRKQIIELGFSEPVSVWLHENQYKLLNGHQRHRAILRMIDEGFECDAIPVSLIEAKSVKEAKKKVLALTSQYGIMTPESLMVFAEEASFDLKEIEDAFRFPEFDFGEIVTPEPEIIPGCNEDEVPEVAKDPITKLGDIFELGDHRLMCGDSTMIDHVEKLMNDEKADMVFTDPPYGINENTDRDFASRTRKCKGNSFDKIIGDDSIQTAMDCISLCESFGIKTQVYWGGNYYMLPPSPCWVVWDKRCEENQRDLNSDCELAWVKHPSKRSVRIFRHLWKGMCKGSENGEARIHPTQKPIALAEWCFRELGENDKLILDLFGGSGSTLIACEKTNRKCFMMELYPHYCDVIINRWQKYSDKKAYLIKDGERIPYNDLMR